jgi:hypothetical protein
MRKPVVARKGRPAAGVCRMGAPRMTAATVDPVGATNSRAWSICPRAYQMSWT